VLINPDFPVGLISDVAGCHQDAELAVAEPGDQAADVFDAHATADGIVELGFQGEGDGYRIGSGPDAVLAYRVAAAVD
jgi:hypothetical protein